MTRLSKHMSFAEELVSYLPAPEAVEKRPGDYWNNLRVNAGRALGSMGDEDYVEENLSPLGLAGLRALCAWLGLEAEQGRAGLMATLAEHLVSERATAACQAILLLGEFLYRRRADAIEEIARLILAGIMQEASNLVYESEIDAGSRRFCYALLVFCWDHRRLQLLLLYDRAERAGYARYRLRPLTKRAGKPLDGEQIRRIDELIRQGVDLNQLDVKRVEGALSRFESSRDGRRSRCFGVFGDTSRDMTLVFVVRDLRPASIREVEEVVFAEQAELIVLRMFAGARSAETHSASRTGWHIATAIAAELFGETNLAYVADTEYTMRERFEAFIGALKEAYSGRLLLQEVYLENAPVPDSPKLILRCEKGHSLAEPLAFFEEQGIDLFYDLGDIHSLNVSYVEQWRAKSKTYIFKLYCRQLKLGDFALSYAVSNIPTSIRARFEAYLRETYDVRAVPGVK